MTDRAMEKSDGLACRCRKQRETMYGHRPGVFWLTGLSGAGKSTLAFGMEERLTRRGMQVAVLDGDRMRQGLCENLGFSLQDRRENLRRVAHVATMLADLGHVCLCACIAPIEEHRALCRTIIGHDYQEIFVSCPLGVCRQRDVKGLYARADAGHIAEYTGMSSPYEVPGHPDLVLHTATMSVEACLDILEQFMLARLSLPAVLPLRFRPQLAVFDFDGVFTDDTVTIDEKGCESVRCHRGDGMGISLLRQHGVMVCILSGETNKVVSARARKLGVQCVQGCADKATFLRSYLHEKAINAGRMVYVGNDVNDLGAMAMAGCSIAPADAHPAVLAAAGHVLASGGGQGAVRECCDILLEACRRHS